MIDECVAMAPGYTHTTGMPCGAPSAASAWVSPVSPNLLAQYADAPAAPLGRPAPDIVLTAANTEQVIGQDRLVEAVAPGHRWARRRAVSAAELAGAPLVSREGGSGTRDTLSAALAAQVPALSMSTTAAVRTAVLAAAAPAVISELAVAEDLAAGRLIEIAAPELDLRQVLRTIWDSNPPAGAARDLISHIP